MVIETIYTYSVNAQTVTLDKLGLPSYSLNLSQSLVLYVQMKWKKCSWIDIRFNHEASEFVNLKTIEFTRVNAVLVKVAGDTDTLLAKNRGLLEPCTLEGCS